MTIHHMKAHHSDFCTKYCTVYDKNGPQKNWCTPCLVKKGDCAWTKEGIVNYLAERKIKLKEVVR